LPVGEKVEVETLARTEGCGQQVVVASVALDGLRVEEAFASFYSLYVLMDVGNVPRSRMTVEGVGCGTKTDIRYIVPIGGIVTGTETGTCEVGYLIVLKACGL
jgi:hypothetical protein